MENLTVPWMGVWQGIEQGRLSLPLTESRKLQMVSVDDVGFFAALALTEPETFAGAGFDIAGDELTGTEMADHLSTHLRTDVAFVSTAAGIEAMRAEHEDGAVMWEEINAVGTNAFLPGLRALHLELSAFGGFSPLQAADTRLTGQTIIARPSSERCGASGRTSAGMPPCSAPQLRKYRQ